MCFFSKFRKNQTPESEQEQAFNKAMARARKFTYNGTQEQREWLDKYAVEEEKSWSMLHRQSRLQKSQMLLQYENDEHSKDPPGYEEPSTLDKELKQLRIDYKKSLLQLDHLRRNMIYGAISEQFMVRHVYKDENNRPYWWRLKIRSCVDIGGCCSRSCGCCEKPLREHLQPTDGGGREVVGVYGHCTSECACCIQHQGFYLPNSHLRETSFK